MLTLPARRAQSRDDLALAEAAQPDLDTHALRTLATSVLVTFCAYPELAGSADVLREARTVAQLLQTQ